MAKRNKVLIVGARGAIGWNLTEHFTALDDWDVVGSSRRAPTAATTADYICVDLLDAEATKSAYSPLADVTHVIYAALLDKPDMAAAWVEKDHVDTNLSMMANAIDALEAAGADLQNIAFLQGTKAYGVHLGPIKVPARERDAMHLPPSFYHAQQDFIFERQKGRSWSWTIYRPQIVCGLCPGAPMNVIASIGVYCVISRELGLPLRFTGNLYAGIVELVDARLLAQAMAWGAINPSKSANEIFNVSNGDVVDWNNLFQRLAEHFNMKLDRPQSLSLHAMMEDKAPVWDEIVKKYDLAPLSYEDVKGNWQAIDFAFRMGNQEPPPIVSTIKLRQAGFHECRDSEDMFIKYIEEMQALRHLPA
ncbi:SDR family oxidoreductase [Sphingosinicella rhizophila]|uniref:SDR family oxidoreductase n=1 Tax=Sphingosinicella rhizophila TaxID=3050082 RepID=A0ABU3QB31_9SPHN|nr:SDR family oxidoreductase [Sphingosinicella sp. GR2756]MDT9600537.1 SDR family oxidoreductase [Sphingosinicella sp. GR2756]